MPVKVPQNVEREDRIVGPLTLRQLLWLLGATGLGVGLFRSYQIGYLYFGEFLALALLGGGLALAFAFARINSYSFTTLLWLLLRYWTGAKKRIWLKTGAKEKALRVIISQAIEPEPTRPHAEVRSELEKLTQIISAGGRVSPETESAVKASEIGFLPEAPAQQIELSENLEDPLKETE